MENIHCEAMGDFKTTNISDTATDLDEKIETMKRMKERADSIYQKHRKFKNITITDFITQMTSTLGMMCYREKGV